tara:strand:- start:37 stop:1314 length:1278 start_codon:yes stop_codon:yes gene_type:complete
MNKILKKSNILEILIKIDANPNSSQRELAEKLKFSLGKLNYCLTELKGDGLIKTKNFSKDPRKANSTYVLTPKGISTKTELAHKFLKEKIEEYDDIVKDDAINIDEKKISEIKYREDLIANSKNIIKKVKKNKKRDKKLFKTIKINIKRRTAIVNNVLSFHENIPIPSWIELSIIDVCNRSCLFCPKSDPKIAPDTYQQMQMVLIEKLTRELKEMKYKGSVTLCGYGEPMLHKEVYIICKKLSEAAFVEVVTNGDTLNSKKIKDLYNNNVNKLLISMYDGKFQIDKFKKMIKDSGVPEDFVILRDRWYDEKKDYGLKLTNRTGTISIGEQEEIGKYKKCFYPAYQFLIDWNGDVFLCPQDWQRRVTMGNIMQENIFKIWSGKIFTKYRKSLLQGQRCYNPCTLCNADGTILGKKHASAWENIYSK